MAFSTSPYSIKLMNYNASKYALTLLLDSYNALKLVFRRFFASSISPHYIIYLKMPLSLRCAAESYMLHLELFSITNSLILGGIYKLPLLFILVYIPSISLTFGNICYD